MTIQKNILPELFSNMYIVYVFVYNYANQETLFHIFAVELGLHFTTAIVISALGAWRLTKDKSLPVLITLSTISILAIPFFLAFMQSQNEFISLAFILTFTGLALNKIFFYTRLKEEAPVWALFYVLASVALLLPAVLVGQFMFMVWGILYFGVFSTYMLYANSRNWWPYKRN